MAQIMYIEASVIMVWLLALCSWRIYRRLNWPVVGMLPELLLNVGRIHEICTQVLNKCRRRTFHFKGPSMDILLTADPENVHHILTSNFLNFPKGPKFKEIFDVMGDGIFNVDSDSWRDQRRVARAFLTHRSFCRFVAKISHDKAERGLIPVLDMAVAKDEVIDLQDLFQRLSFDTTCLMITGYDPGCLSIEFCDVPFSKAMDDAEEAIFMRHVLPEKVWKLQRLVGVGPEKKLKQARKILDTVIQGYISSKRQEFMIKNLKSDHEIEDGTDLLTSYMSSVRNEDDDKFLRDTVLNLMIAGRDTTSSALTWLIWLISTHPSVENKIREELGSVTTAAEGRRVFGVDEVKKLVYLHGAVLEALRLYPPVPFQHKEPLKHDILPTGHLVTPEMKVMFSLYAMGRMESIWGKDCKEFKPERWISDGGSIKHEPSYKFLAFNAGPRTCLGKEVALSQIKAVAATIIYNYQVRVAEGHLVAPNCSVILYMQRGLKVKVANKWSTN